MARLWAQRDDVEQVYIVDKAPLAPEHHLPKISAYKFDVTEADYSFFDRFTDIDTLMITAGFGRMSLFRNIDETVIQQSFDVNTVPTMRLAKRFYAKLEGREPFRMGVMVSIAGFMSSPFLSVYASTKAALRVFIESVNVELEKSGSPNRILNVSPGKVRGTLFHDNSTNLDMITPLALDIIQHLEVGDDLFIPKYEEVYREVLNRYHTDFRAEGRHSYEYKSRASAKLKVKN